LQRKPATRVNLEKYMIEQPTTQVARAA